MENSQNVKPQDGLPFPFQTLSDTKRFFARKTTDPLSGAFSEKFVIHAGQSGSIVKDLTLDLFSSLLSGDQKPLGLYIHIPFCMNHCLYCGFAGQFPKADLINHYADALISELIYLSSSKVAKGPVRTVYLGGGTPSCLDPEKLKELIATIKNGFHLANDCELTLEGAIHDFTPERIDGFLEAGFNRFSLGIQTFDTGIRKSLGRRSKSAEAIGRLEDLVSRSMAAVIIDLIYGLPGQSCSIFLRDLDIACGIGIDGLDTYQLNVFSKGELIKAVESGKIEAPAPLAAQGRYYALGYDYLLAKHWKPLSLSHYSRTSRERNIYNPWAKSRQNCLGVGAGAGGFLAGHAYFKLPQVEKYLKSAVQGEFAPDFITRPPKTEELASYIVAQTEEGYLDFADLSKRFGVDQSIFTPFFDNWKEAGLVEIYDGWLLFTVAGRFWGVNLSQAVVELAANAFFEAKGE
ncbi:MAG: heme anaerobic degradation radical SAM methyltransferase ChuW/HutW [Deltaproteobacteria bacterium]|jgi:oxygen-independent coproporphyrinogen-3 oxidase|nr:heme anaerobic degradation radical SAM methyltransferase ChuW/HutW [Deltaproteobacteria bacterium]